MLSFMFATGIENSVPKIKNGRHPVDELEKCGFYKHWRKDFDLVQELGILLRHIGTARKLTYDSAQAGKSVVLRKLSTSCGHQITRRSRASHRSLPRSNLRAPSHASSVLRRRSCGLWLFGSFNKCERFIATIHIENSVTYVRQQSAFDAGCKSHPCLVCDDGHPAKPMKVSKHWH